MAMVENYYKLLLPSEDFRWYEVIIYTSYDGGKLEWSGRRHYKRTCAEALEEARRFGAKPIAEFNR